MSCFLRDSAFFAFYSGKPHSLLRYALEILFFFPVSVLISSTIYLNTFQIATIKTLLNAEASTENPLSVSSSRLVNVLCLLCS